MDWATRWQHGLGSGWLSGCLPKNGANHSVRWSAGRIVKKKQEQQGDPSRTDSAGGSELAGLRCLCFEVRESRAGVC